MDWCLEPARQTSDSPMRNMTTPLGSGGSTAGRPTVRKAEPPQRAQEDPRSQRRHAERRQETGNPCIGPSAEWLPHNWSDTGGCPARKGADVGLVSL